MVSSYLCVVFLPPFLQVYERNFFLFFYQSGLFSATILGFIAGGNSKMLCGPVAANTLLVAQMSHDLMDMLNLDGTDNDTKLAVLPPSPMSFRPSVSVWINVIWSISLTLSFMCTFFGWCLRRWALRYYFYNSPRIDSRDPRHHRSQAIEGPDASRPSAIVALLHFFLPLSVFLFYFGLIVFLIHIDVTLGLAFVSLLVIAGLLYVSFLFINAQSHLTGLRFSRT